jgi:hypothetical protein
MISAIAKSYNLCLSLLLLTHQLRDSSLISD